MPARILIVTPMLLHGGVNPRTIRSRRLIAGLARRGFEVESVAWSSGEEPRPAAAAGAPLLAVAGPNPLRDLVGARRLLHPLRRRLGAEPDGLGPWARAVLAALAARPRPDLVYAIGLPLGALSAGYLFAERLGVPLVHDLGDPWKPKGLRERALMRRTLARAAALVTTSPALARSLEPHLDPGAEVLLCPNGGELRRRSGTREPPLFVHLGAIPTTRVAPEPAFAALAALAAEGRIELRSHSQGWHPGFDSLPVRHRPMLPHAEALDLLAEASAALVLGCTNREQLPSKAFELACTETWALCVRELDDDPATAVLERGGHAVAARNEEVAIRAAVEEILAREARGERPEPVAAYTWERRIDEIAALIGRLAR